MKEIQLSQNKVAIVDDADFALVSQFKWTYLKARGSEYARRNEGRKTIRLHRFLMAAPHGVQVDHINGNGLDNRRKNLRLCNNQQNHQNSRKLKPASSIYKGVYRARHKWRAQIALGGKNVYLGVFATEAEAARAYDSAATKHYGTFARLNLEVKNDRPTM